VGLHARALTQFVLLRNQPRATPTHNTKC